VVGHNPLKLLNVWDTIENKTQQLHLSDDTGVEERKERKRLTPLKKYLY
jgi:hypothetical protein